MSTKKTKSSARKSPSKSSTASARGKLKMLKIVKVGEQPRREGTAAFKRYAEMAKYVKSHRGAIVSDVLKETAYRSNDYHWDVKRNHITVK